MPKDQSLGVPMKARLLPKASVTSQTMWRKLLMPKQPAKAPAVSPPGGTTRMKPRDSLPTNPPPEFKKPTISPASLMPRAAEPF